MSLGERPLTGKMVCGIAVTLMFGLGAAGIRDALHVVHAQEDRQSRITLPAEYRDWKLISVAHEAGNLNDLRAVLGNDAVIKAYRNGSSSLPDGSMIARLAWTYSPSPENNRAFGREQSYVAGSPTNIQLMVKDSHRFITTGGWGYAQFANAGSTNAITQTAANQCFACHTPARAHDYVFTHYAP